MNKKMNWQVAKPDTRNRAWIDLGSDVNWREHGGLWGRALDENTWEVVKFFDLESVEVLGGPKYWAAYTTHSLENPDLPAALEASGVESDAPDADKIAALAAYTSNWAETYFYRGNEAKQVLRSAKAGCLLVRKGVTVSSRMAVAE